MSGAIAATVAVGAYSAYQNRKSASAQKKATGQAANQQLEATQRQINYLERADRAAERRLRPFVNLGRENVDEYQMMLTPQGQYEYLQANPMFQAAVDYSGDRISAANAAGGRFNSGGTVDQLFKNYLATGEDFVSNQFNRLYNTVGLGQASAAQTSANSLNSANSVSGIVGNQGDIRSSALINRANINNQQQQNQMGMIAGGLLGSGVLGNQGFGAGGWGGALGGMLMACDERLKENIERVGETDEGIPLYKFNYKGDYQVYFGPMAQDVERVKPNAVITDQATGFKLVNAGEI